MKHNIATKYVAAGLAVVLFLGLTVWLIRSEGQRTRESIREAAREAGSEVRKGLVEGAVEAPGKIVRDVTQEVAGQGGSTAKQMVGEVGRVSGDVLRDVTDILRPAEQADTKTSAPAPPEKSASPPTRTGQEEKPPTAAKGAGTDTPSQPAPAPAVPNKEDTLKPRPQGKPSPPPVQPESNPSPVGESAGRVERKSGQAPGDSPPDLGPSTRSKPVRPADPIGQIFDLGHQVSRAVDEVGQDVFALSWEEERKVGQDVHRMVAREHQLLRPPAVIERLQRLARPIVNQRTRKEVIFTLEVIKSDEVNAFAHAGGYIYVNTGMLNFTKPDAELQFFLAHEIAHQELKHVVKRMTYAARASQVGGQAASTLAQMAYLTIATGYSKEQELEADAWAFRALLRAGRSRDEALSGMRHILTYVNQKKLEPQRSEPGNPAGKTLQQIENHFRSHPPTAERLKQLEGIQG